ncbi:MAG: Peroxide-responsive repressor PerR [Candidatus Latescibacteria bacterium ADurb.Bin168]|nr:MAG: Peroxide-responsive repressor PerR [Candidatus Latescibacteria bacterium ADurb.Bin168]
MESDSTQIEQRVQRFCAGLRNAGVKLTHQRLEILRELAVSHSHPDAETVHRQVRKRVPTLSLDTVYRTLWMLLDLGLITTLGPFRGRARFDTNVQPHHHFFCKKCGLARDFTCAEYDQLTVPIAVETLGEVDRVEVEVWGVCADCTGNAGPKPG